MVLNRRRRNIFLIPVLIGCLCVSVFAVQGCAPLRKKFTRKKKKENEQSQKFIPVLEPVDYEIKVKSAVERYKYHYSLWKVWDKDLLQTIERDGSDKRQKYLLGQIIEQLTQMQKWLTGDKQGELGQHIDDLGKVQQDYEKPASMRNKFRIKTKIQSVAKKIRGGFAPKLALPYSDTSPDLRRN